MPLRAHVRRPPRRETSAPAAVATMRTRRNIMMSTFRIVILSIMESDTLHVNPGGAVRISELSQRSGVAVATIKYYLREGLLPPGASTAPNQAQYDEQHLTHLHLIRALREGAGLSIATLARVFEAMWSHQASERPR